MGGVSLLKVSLLNTLFSKLGAFSGVAGLFYLLGLLMLGGGCMRNEDWDWKILWRAPPPGGDLVGLIFKVGAAGFEFFCGGFWGRSMGEVFFRF